MPASPVDPHLSPSENPWPSASLLMTIASRPSTVPNVRHISTSRPYRGGGLNGPASADPPPLPPPPGGPSRCTYSYSPLSLERLPAAPPCPLPAWYAAARSAYSSMRAGTSPRPSPLAPAILLNMSSSTDSGVAYRSHFCAVRTLPDDFDILRPPLSRNISYRAWCGGGVPSTSSHTQSFTRTESMMSLPCASNLTSNACQRAANSTFQASLPGSLPGSDSALWPHPSTAAPPTSAPTHEYDTLPVSGSYDSARAVYSLPHRPHTGK